MARFFSPLFVLLLFLQRPAALGQTYAGLGMVALILLTIAYLAWKNMRVPRPVRSDMLVLGSIIAAYLLYETAIALAFGMSFLPNFFKEIVITTIVVVCYAMFLSERSNNEIFFRQLTTVISLLGWSSAITIGLALVGDVNSIAMFQIPMKGYEGGEEVEAGTVFFPLSMGFMGIQLFDFPLIRFTGFFREPGIYQAVAAYCLVVATLASQSIFVRLGLVLGILCAFSTIGVAMLIAALGIAYFLRKRITFSRIAVTAAVLGFGVFAAIYTPVVGLADKGDIAEVSITERADAISKGLMRVAENPLGYGPFSSREANQDITLLAAIGSIGLLGFLLQVILLSGFRGELSRTTLERMGACAPILVTALFSQPIAGAAMMYVLIMIRPETHQRLPKRVRTQALR